jgi:hypothetical protein
MQQNAPEPLMDAQHLIEQAARCRRLAETTTDKRFREELLKLEKEYLRQADELNRKGGNESSGNDRPR